MWSKHVLLAIFTPFNGVSKEYSGFVTNFFNYLNHALSDSFLVLAKILSSRCFKTNGGETFITTFVNQCGKDA